MRHKTYGLALPALVLPSCAILAAVSLGMDPLVGDLTRVGKFRENEHGYNGPQKRFARRLYDSDVYDRPYDVVVWGDSFSFDAEAGWENFFAEKTGAGITAIHHAQMTLPEIMGTEAFRKSPPKLFVYEIVERSLKDRLGDADRACRPKPGWNRMRLAAKPSPALSDAHERPREKAYSDVNMGYALDYLFTGLLRRTTGRIGEAAELKLTKPLFTSAAADSLLVFKDDLKKRNWTPELLRSVNCGLAQMQDKVQSNGKTAFVAVIIPDKLTVYSPYLAEPRWAGLSVMGAVEKDGFNYPRIDLALAAAVAAGTKDVYLPDDTHLGSAGYEIVAGELMKYLKTKGALR